MILTTAGLVLACAAGGLTLGFLVAFVYDSLLTVLRDIARRRTR